MGPGARHVAVRGATTIVADCGRYGCSAEGMAGRWRGRPATLHHPNYRRIQATAEGSLHCVRTTAIPQPRHIAHRWCPKQPLVLAAELRGIAIAHSHPRRAFETRSQPRHCRCPGCHLPHQRTARSPPAGHQERSHQGRTGRGDHPPRLLHRLAKCHNCHEDYQNNPCRARRRNRLTTPPQGAHP